MVSFAELIRMMTPGWTEDERHAAITFVHKLLTPGCILGFVLTQNRVFRWFVVFWIFQTVITQLTLRRCAIRLLERKFSNKRYVDSFSGLFHMFDWDVTRSEKMTFNIGLNIGVLVVFSLMLLKESLLWMVGLAGVTVTALPTLALFSTVLHFRDIAELPLPNIHPA